MKRVVAWILTLIMILGNYTPVFAEAIDSPAPVEIVQTAQESTPAASPAAPADQPKAEATAEAPTSTDAPAATDIPAATDAPVTTDVPASTDIPAATDAPVTTDAPASIEALQDVQPADAPEAPEATENPKSTEEPSSAEDPQATEASLATDAPEATEEPKTTDAPEVCSAYHHLNAGQKVYTGWQCSKKLGEVIEGCDVLVVETRVRGEHTYLQIMFDTDQTRSSGNPEIGYVRAKNPVQWKTEAQDRETQQKIQKQGYARTHGGWLIPCVRFIYAKAEATEAAASLQPTQTPETEQTAESTADAEIAETDETDDEAEAVEDTENDEGDDAAERNDGGEADDPAEDPEDADVIEDIDVTEDIEDAIDDATDNGEDEADVDDEEEDEAGDEDGEDEEEGADMLLMSSRSLSAYARVAAGTIVYADAALTEKMGCFEKEAVVYAPDDTGKIYFSAYQQAQADLRSCFRMISIAHAAELVRMEGYVDASALSRIPTSEVTDTTNTAPEALFAFASPENTRISSADLDAMLLEKANGLYSSGQADLITITPIENRTYYAGEICAFRVRITWPTPGTWGSNNEPGYDTTQNLFDHYTNNTLTIKVPAGLKISGYGDDMNPQSVNVSGDMSTGLTYTYTLPDRDAANSTISFAMNVYIGGNGTVNAINDYAFLQDSVSFSTSFQILNKANTPATPVENGSFTLSDTGSAGSFSTASLDAWGMKKRADQVELVENESVARVTYSIAVGLTDANGVVLDDVTSSTSEYRRNGRNAFAAPATLNESLTGYLTGELQGTNMTQLSATIQKRGSTVAQSFTNASDITLSGDLALNETVYVDSDGDNDREQAVPVYTVYTVVANYEITDAMRQHFTTPDASKTYFQNDAGLTTKLAKCDPVTRQASANIPGTLPVNTPATLEVDKYLTEYTGETKSFEGVFTYAMQPADAAGTVYTKAGDLYVPLVAENGKYPLNDQTRYYLTPGIAYTITEELTAGQENQYELIGQKLKKNGEEQTDAATFTPVAGASYLSEFTNSDRKGRITIVKKRENGTLMSNVRFYLYLNKDSNSCIEAWTDEAGVCVFDQVPYGAHRLMEDTPDGYRGIAAEDITVDSTNRFITKEYENQKVATLLQLNKYVGLNSSSMKPANNEYSANFRLQRSATPNIEGSWENVEYDASGHDVAQTVNEQGKLQVLLPAFSDTGEVYDYRFVETIPAGYYDVRDPYTTTAVSEAVTLVDESGDIKESITEINMYNYEKVKLTVAKHFYDVTLAPNTMADSLVENNAQTTTVTLYEWNGFRMTSVGEGTSTAKTVGATTTAVWDHSPLYQQDSTNSEKTIQYYIAESEVPGYQLDLAASGFDADSVFVYEGKKYLKVNFTEKEKAITLYNMQQKTPVMIQKKDYYAKAYVPGAKMTITDGTSPVENGNNVSVPEGGCVVWLDNGKRYTLTETECPDGWVQVNATAQNPITIDLTNTIRSYNQGQGQQLAVYTLYNKPHPRLQVIKKDSVTQSNVTGAQFTVFTRNGDAFTRLLDEGGNPRVIAAGTTSDFELPVGEYWLAETTVPSGYLNPNLVPEEYTTALGSQYTFERGTVDGQTYTFVKVQVQDAPRTETSTTPNIATFTFRNIPNTGKMKVQKYVNGQAAKVAGFQILIYNGDVQVAEGTTNANGVAEFTLPVYNESHEKITYTIKEGEMTEALTQKYFFVADGQTVQLTPCSAVSEYNGQVLRVENGTTFDIIVRKHFEYSWDYWYTNAEFPLPGTGLQLYQLDEAGENWAPASEVVYTHGVTGNARFYSLRSDVKYVVVEISSPKENLYPYQNGEYKLFAAADTSIPVAELERYNALVFDAQYPQAAENQIGYLHNRNYWVQFEIEKYLDKDTYDIGEPLLNRPDIAPEDTPYNYAVYALYRKVMPEGETDAGSPEDGSWTKVGEYSTGTLYRGTQRQDGTFRTEVDMNAGANVVYMLQETNAGPNGAEMYPGYIHTFYRAAGTNYTTTLSNARVRNYRLNAITHDQLLNAQRVTGDGGTTMIASVRLTKWADQLDENANLTHEYQPLLRSEFQMLYGDTVLAVMHPGKETNQNTTPSTAKAASGAFLLMPPQGTTVTEETSQFVLLPYEDNGEGAITSGIPVTATYLGATGNGCMLFGVPVTIRETQCPETYQWRRQSHEMYMVFLHDPSTAVSSVYNDLFYVLEGGAASASYTVADDVNGREWRITAGDTVLGSVGAPLRLVNYPSMDNYVRVTKYGYTPNENTLNKTSDALDALYAQNPAAFSRDALGGVTMSLQKLEGGRWVHWDYTYLEGDTFGRSSTAVQTFVTRADGSFVFPRGLSNGTYKIVETSLGAHADRYEMNYKNTARIFTVNDNERIITMYDTPKVSLRIQKQDPAGNSIGVAANTFQLHRVGTNLNESGTVQAGTSDTVAFRNIPYGWYALQETAPQGYTQHYLKQYFAAAYPDYADFVDSDAGMLLGYVVEHTGSSGEYDICVRQIGIQDLIPDGLITIENPALGSWTIQKHDEDNPQLPVEATFSVSRCDFAAWNDTGVLSADSTWVPLGTITTQNGAYTFENAIPGVYRLEETGVAKGYEKLYDADGPLVYYIVVTGGMPIADHTGLPEQVQILASDGETSKQVTIKRSGTGADAPVSIAIANRKMAKAAVSKQIQVDHYTSEQLAALQWQVTIDLYDRDNVKVGTATLTNETAGSVTFRNPANPGEEALLSRGYTYFAKETVDVAPTGAAVDVAVNVRNIATAATENGYPITITEAEGNTLDFVNHYMHGKVSFRKVDDSDPTKLLTGAGFTVYYVDANDERQLVPGAVVTENPTTHYYEADIPLISADPTVYVIVETKAPDHYVLLEGKEITVTLSAMENELDYTTSTTAGQYLENTEMFDLQIIKYRNLHDYVVAAEDPEAYRAGMADVTFALYQKVGDEWKLVDDEPIDADGQVTWSLKPQEWYAFRESYFDPARFTDAESIYNATAAETRVEDTMTITVNGVTLQAVDIGTLNEDKVYKVYNKPYLKAKIVKKDVGGYNGTLVGAYFDIYELESPLPADQAEAKAAVDALIAAGQKPIVSHYTDKVKDGILYYEWGKRDPEKYYAIVETVVGSQVHLPYDTLNRDDNRVRVQLAVPRITDDPLLHMDEEFELLNVYSDADLAMEKTVSAGIENSDVFMEEGTPYVDSLFKGSRDVAFTITPTVTSHNQPLHSFVVEDEGLAFRGEEAEYAITQLVLGQASHTPDTFIGLPEGFDDSIQATVRFTLADATTTEMVVTGVSEEAKTVIAPPNAVSFTVSYTCEAVRSAVYSADTGVNEPYALGRDFNPGVITVYATVTQLRDDQDNPAAEVSQITNTARAEMHYLKWSNTGDGATMQTVTKAASASISVKPVVLPKVKLVKNLVGVENSVNVQQTIQYKFTITNESDTEPFVNPVILDLLPTGFAYTGNYSVNNAEFMATVSRYTGTQQTVFGDSQTAVSISLFGELAPNAVLEVTLECRVDQEAVLYEENPVNYAFLSSDTASYHIKDINPNGYPFCNELSPREYPPVLTDAAADFGVAGARLAAMGDTLDEFKAQEYVWVRSQKAVGLLFGQSAALKKYIRGDQDSSFHSEGDFLATASRTKEEIRTGWVDYRLQLMNTSSMSQNYILFSDVIPKQNDYLGSKWSVIMDQVNAVMVNGQGVNYTLYYYTGTLDTAPNAARAALNEASAFGWPSNMPEGWHAANEVTDKDAITAFCIVVGENVSIDPGDSAVVIFHTLVKEVTDAEFDEIAFENNNNRFYAGFDGHMVLESNIVCATVLDGYVQVEGDVWIDEDWSGTQRVGGNRRNYDEYAVVNLLKNALSFRIVDDRLQPSGSTTAISGSHSGIGESVRHFGFGQLGGGYAKMSDLYKAATGNFKDYELNRSALKTKDPYMYHLEASIAGNSTSLLYINGGVFALTGYGEHHYQSDNPGAIPAANALDSNFYSVTDTENGFYMTNPFYLQYVSATDQSKDIGFKMYRNLEITKVDGSGANTPIQGAKFVLYGPFDAITNQTTGPALRFTANADGSYTYAPESGTVTELVSDENGKIRVNGLNWWKEYLIRETATDPDGNYNLESAEAFGDSGTVVEAVGEALWALRIPAKDRTTPLDTVTVKNFSDISAELKVSKCLTENSAGPQTTRPFRFVLEAVDQAPMPVDAMGQAVTAIEMHSPAAKTDEVTRSFGIFTFTRKGVYTYKVREERLANVDYGCFPVPYTQTHTVVFTVADKDGGWQVSASVDGVAVMEGETALVRFANEYQPAPVTRQIPVRKTVAGIERPQSVRQTFAFTVEAAQDSPADTPLPQNTTLLLTDTGEEDFFEASAFDTIVYTQAGEWQYTITEENIEEPSIICDARAWTVTVTVVDVNGELQVTSCTFVDNEQRSGEQAAFTNRYQPTPAAVTLPFVKAMNGQPMPGGMTKTFTFELYKQGEAAPLQSKQVTIPAVSAGAFDELTFDQPGEYHYTVKEQPLTDDVTITCDTTQYAVDITVYNRGAALEAEVQVNREAFDTTADKLTFTNTYRPVETELNLPLQKTILGLPRPENSRFTYTFTLEAVTDAAPMPAVATVEITDTGEEDFFEASTFDTIVYTQAGEWQYTITEENIEEPSITCDETVWQITVTVVDRQGQLEAAYEMTHDQLTDSVALAEFTNQYTVLPAKVHLEAEKIFSRGHIYQMNRRFRFVLSEVVDGTEEEIEIVYNNPAPQVHFSDIVYERPGEYAYIIREIDDHLPDIIYDKTEFKVYVTVVDEGGQLTATVNYEEPPVFRNIYTGIVPKTGYGPNRNGWLIMLGCISLLTLILALKKKAERRAE